MLSPLQVALCPLSRNQPGLAPLDALNQVWRGDAIAFGHPLCTPCIPSPLTSQACPLDPSHLTDAICKIPRTRASPKRPGQTVPVPADHAISGMDAPWRTRRRRPSRSPPTTPCTRLAPTRRPGHPLPPRHHRLAVAAPTCSSRRRCRAIVRRHDAQTRTPPP